MSHSIRCSCGNLEGLVTPTDWVNRCVCYCRDCQAFAHALNRAGEILDAHGGTDIVQTTPAALDFHKGIEHLACLRLTSKGLLRWYAACCNTPIGNTPANCKIAMVGLIHNCLQHAEVSLDQVFGPVRMRISTKAAIGDSKPKSIGLFRGTSRVVGMILWGRFSGTYKKSPLFDADSGLPVVRPKILSSAERQALHPGA